MKTFIPLRLFICLLLLSFACNERKVKEPSEVTDYTGFHPFSFDLKNNLGKVTLMVPDEFNMFHQKIDMSDYVGGDEYVHAFYDTTYGYYLNYGFFDSVKGDSLWGLEVRQGCRIDLVEGDVSTFFDTIPSLTQLQTYSKPGYFICKCDTIRICGEKFMYAITERAKSSAFHRELSLVVWTYLSQNLLSFEFICQAQDEKDFIDRMMTCMKSVCIE